MDHLSPWLHDNWVWLAIIFLLLFLGEGIRSLRDNIRSLRDSILKIPEQTRQSAEHFSSLSELSSIDDRLRRIETLMSASEDRQRKRDRQKHVESERLKWHDPSEPPARSSCYERLQKLKHFVEHSCGGDMGTADIPSEVWFSLPVDNNEALIEALAANNLILDTGEKVQIRGTGATHQSPRRPLMIGRSFMVDLFSLDDDELELITSLRTSAWPGPTKP